MGVCISTVVTSDGPALEAAKAAAGPESVREVVSQQPKRTADFDAEDSPLPCCCLFCVHPNLCELCCGCGQCCDCDLCSCCLECNECCGQCLTNCI